MSWDFSGFWSLKTLVIVGMFVYIVVNVLMLSDYAEGLSLVLSAIVAIAIVWVFGFWLKDDSLLGFSTIPLIANTVLVGIFQIEGGDEEFGWPNIAIGVITALAYIILVFVV